MKNISKNRLVMITILGLLSIAIQAQTNEQITGIINQKWNGNDEIVICEFGTQVCETITIEQRIVVENLIRTLKPEELKVGWYVNADIDSQNLLNSVEINQNKTIVCFENLSKRESKRIQNFLESLEGVYRVSINQESSQAYIEFDKYTISYSDILNRIIGSNFEIEYTCSPKIV